MEDHIIRATAADGAIRAFAAVTTEMVRQAHAIHKTSGVASAALGRTLTSVAMMSRMMKNEQDVLTIQIKGDGPLGGIVVVSDANSNVRGYVHNPQVYMPPNASGRFDVGQAVGKSGYLNVIKDMGLKEPYVGQVNLMSGEIGEDIAYYFAASEQIPTVVALGELINTDESIAVAGGYIIQLMPEADEEIVEYLEDKIFFADFVTTMLTDGLEPSQILERLLGEKGLCINERLPCRYHCNCSRERMERNLVTLGADEILEMADEQHGAELLCHFCNKKYYFSEDELRSLVLPGKE